MKKVKVLLSAVAVVAIAAVAVASNARTGDRLFTTGTNPDICNVQTFKYKLQPSSPLTIKITAVAGPCVTQHVVETPNN